MFSLLLDKSTGMQGQGRRASVGWMVYKTAEASSNRLALVYIPINNEEEALRILTNSRLSIFGFTLLRFVSLYRLCIPLIAYNKAISPHIYLLCVYLLL